MKARAQHLAQLEKCPSGIEGLDDLLHGGFPAGRATLITGGPGSGKSLLALETLVRGAQEMDEPGVYFSFEESTEESITNSAVLGFDIAQLIEQDRLALYSIPVFAQRVSGHGEFSLDALLLQIRHAVDLIGAKRLVLDSVDALFHLFQNHSGFRTEFSRLLHKVKEMKVTLLLTSERENGEKTPYRTEEYVADCVLLLDNRIREDMARRRVRILKYRGSSHGTNEYSFLISEGGLSLLPLSGFGLDHTVSRELISFGHEDLDELLGGGVYRGSTLLISGSAGTGKSSLAAQFVAHQCEQGRRCLYLASEESADQIIRNMQSIGLDLASHVDSGKLVIKSRRPAFQNLEEHLLSIVRQVDKLKPDVAVLDPITNYLSMGSVEEVKSMLTRVFDHLKRKKITALLTSLTYGGQDAEQSSSAVSSLMDTWMVCSSEHSQQAIRRQLYIVKSRGMAHSGEIVEFKLNNQGFQLVHGDEGDPRSTEQKGV